MNTQTPSFRTQFSRLCKEATESAAATQSGIKSVVESRAARFELILSHVKAGGTLTEKQLARLSSVEQVIVRAVLITNDPNVKKAAAQADKAVEGIEKAIAKGAKSVSDAFDKIIDGLKR